MTFARKKKTDGAPAAMIGSCCAGEIVPLDKLPLGVLLGNGFCIEPADNVFCCPVSGTVKDIAGDGTSVTFKTAEGLIVIASLVGRDGGRPAVSVCQTTDSTADRGAPLWECDLPPETLTALVVVTNCGEDSYSVSYGNVKSLCDNVMSVTIAD